MPWGEKVVLSKFPGRLTNTKGIAGKSVKIPNLMKSKDSSPHESTHKWSCSKQRKVSNFPWSWPWLGIPTARGQPPPPTLAMAVAQLRPASSISWSTLNLYSSKSSWSMAWASFCLEGTGGNCYGLVSCLLHPHHPPDHSLLPTTQRGCPSPQMADWTLKPLFLPPGWIACPIRCPALLPPSWAGKEGAAHCLRPLGDEKPALNGPRSKGRLDRSHLSASSTSFSAF